MKRNVFYRIILAAAALPCIASCDFLNIEKLGKSDIETYFSEVNALVPAVYGSYSLLYSFYDSYFISYAEVAGDLVNVSGSSSSWTKNFDFETTAEDEASPVGYIWKQAFNIISNANQIIYHAPLLKKDNPSYENLIDHVTAQGYFIRALMEFDLCLVYGQNYTFTADASHPGVPLILRIPAMDDVVKRVSVEKVYAQVIDDLITAKKLFEGSTYSIAANYFASADACDALLARIYLYMGDYDNAINYSGPLIEKYPLTPAEDYLRMFEKSTTYASPECILRLNGYSRGSQLGSFYNYESPTAFPSAKLSALYDAGDIRLGLHSFTKYAGTDSARVYTGVNMKYYCDEPELASKDRHYDPFLFRASEMVLIHAEASCAKGDTDSAEADLRKLVARAHGKEASEVTLSYSGKDGLDKLIMQERMKELSFEGHRFFDIARRHENLERGVTNSKVKTLRYPDNRFVLAIPRVERDANPYMEQNEGY